jgi:transposase
MSKCITYIGLDAHKETITAAVLLPRRRRADLTTVANEDTSVRRFIRRVRKKAPGPVVACYEAGPTGFALKRLLDGLEVDCQVIAPSLIPAKPGDRIKTDRRDATKLAELLRADLLTEVHPPTESEEAVRDLCRAREQAVRDTTTAKHRLTKFLLRRGHRCASRAWTLPWWKWVRGLQMPHEADRIVLDNYIAAVEQAQARVEALSHDIERLSKTEPYAAPVGRLRCFRGIDTNIAMTIVTELHGFERFQDPRQLMAYLGLVPSEYSSGGTTKRGALTKTGNGHVRRALIEAAWHYRHRPHVGSRLKKRRRGQPAGAVALAERAQQRLCKRRARLSYRGKEPNKVTAAIARELAGFVWAALTQERVHGADAVTRWTATR